ncbi:MAG: aminomethyl-transferring glycine dehydrogenase subunit GcvPB [Candidatus Bipolaricaulota bacterium]
MKNIYQKSSKGRRAVGFDEPTLSDQEPEETISSTLLRDEKPNLPEVSRPEITRHYTELSKANYGVDDGLYPLGSCTMKYNPKHHEDLAKQPGFSSTHPLQDGELSQGNLELMYRLGEYLKTIGGMDAITLQPAAGAHGELTGMLMIRKYHEVQGQLNEKREILLPDSAHGTNPASANVAGFQVREIKSNERGMVDLEKLEDAVGSHTAGIMLTVPNTLGIFECDILEVAEIVHEAGGLCYFDGANLNAFLGKVRPGDMNMDIVHYNLHKTFSTPHGGGGPGAGPVAVADKLADYLPVPIVEHDGSDYYLKSDLPHSIGKVSPYYGNFGVMIKAFTYIWELGDRGLEKVGERAVLNANYLCKKLQNTYPLPFESLCKHEFVLSGKEIGEDLGTVDIAKRLLDYGYHPPTVYFPLIVKEALMIEPTETEPKHSLDEFVEAMKEIAQEAREKPELLHQAPTRTPVGRLDETQAARNPIFTWAQQKEES